MGNVFKGIPEELVLSLHKKYSIQLFIETGTYYGETASWASKYFEKVWTIEASKELFQKAIESYGKQENIIFLCGRSKENLLNIISEFTKPAMFWLDAHWSAGNTYGEGEKCPLMDELRIINQAQSNNFILVDDARLFMYSPPPPHPSDLWPNIVEVLNELTKNNRYVIIIDDVIVAVPHYAKFSIIEYGRMRALEEMRQQYRSKRDTQEYSHIIFKWLDYLASIGRRDTSK